MISAIQKHALGNYKVTVSKTPYAYDMAYELFFRIYIRKEYSDIKLLLGMSDHEGIDECSFYFKADLETLETVLEIMKDDTACTTTGLESIITQIK